MASIGQRSRKSIAPSIPDNRDAQASAQACCSKATGDNDAATGARQSEFTSTSIQKHALEKNPNPSALAAMHERGICIRNTRPSEIAKAMAVFEAQARFSHAMALPRGDQLLTLIQFNVLRALFSNTRSLGFGLEWLSPESQSPFTTKSIPDELQIAAVDLRPSRLQMAVLHHPWIDLLPSATMRDNILRAMDTFDEDDLCNDLVDFDGVANEKTGLIAWDTPWRAFGWEVSPAFLEKWPWVLEGCDDLITSTDYWRALRGERALRC